MGFHPLPGGGSAPTIVPGGNLGASRSETVAANGETWLTGTLNANHVLTLTIGAGGRLRLFGVQDGVGSRTLTVSDGVNTQALAIPTGAGAAFEVDFYSPDGTTIFVNLSGAQGATGATGPAGAAGSTGATGPAGPGGRSFVPGKYYQGDVVGQDSTVGLGNNALTTVPFSVGETTTFDLIGVEVTTVAAATNLRMGIYGDTRGPGSLVLDAGLTSADASTTGFKSCAISQSLTPGNYWVCVVAQGGGPTIRGVGAQPNGRIGLSTSGSAWAGYYSVGAVSGALPATFGTPSTNSNVAHPKILMRAV